MKRFLAYVSLQPKNYNAVCYDAQAGDEKLQYGKTRLPILPVINAVVEEKEQIEVILVSTDMEKSDMVETNETAYTRNLRWTEEELRAWAEKKNVDMRITHIRKEDTSSMKELLRLFDMLIGAVDEGWTKEDVFYADITFGMKTMTLIMLYVLRYIRAVKKNEVGYLVYGQYQQTGVGTLHNVTTLFYMDSIISRLGSMPVADPVGLVHACFADMLSDEEENADDE